MTGRRAAGKHFTDLDLNKQKLAIERNTQTQHSKATKGVLQ
jgi:hypothetical protein